MRKFYFIFISTVSLLILTSVRGYAISLGIDTTAFVTNQILSCPTDTSIIIRVVPKKILQIYFEYGMSPSDYSNESETVTSMANVPIKFELHNLFPNTCYYYRIRYKESGATEYIFGDQCTFITQRSRGNTFKFTITGDSHLYDKKGIPSMMRVTMQNILKDSPDFDIEMGDTFGDDRNPPAISQQDMMQLHLNYLSYLGMVGHSAPFYFCLGNHEAESGYWLLQTPPNNLAVWGTLARKYYYSLPSPNGFYTGNSEIENYGIGLPENYYAWEWGDALFVVLDVYRYAAASANPGLWDWTIGLQQYNWFKQTLEGSSAKYKFVFAHHVSGYGRGGVLLANKYEWGGYNNDGTTWGFTTNRPGWALPLHQLMVQNHVSIFFQGHDHLFAKEVLDGVVYQEVPMPSDSTYMIGWLANSDAYTGDKLSGTGHLRVTVAPEAAKVEYVAAYLPQDTNSTHRNGEVVFSYTVSPNTVVETDTIKFICNELLSRPTSNSITIHACANKDIDVYYEYGPDSLNYLNQTNVQSCLDSIPFVFVLNNLNPNAQYFYRMRYRETGMTNFLARSSHTFHTQRPSGSTFTFAIEADPHLDSNSIPAVYALTLQNILSKNPDFLIDLGDTFMSEKLPVKNQSTIRDRHLLLRSYFDIACHSVPLFLAIGNHEGELGWRLDGTPNNLAVWATNTRKLYYPNPAPDAFYSGNSKPEPYVGLRENYYAWQWGNSLFIVLDPYWYTQVKPDWGWTLGVDQYNWFKNVLTTSNAKFKFIFCHNLVGGNGNDARGGTEFAHLFEMGGRNLDSTWGFDTYRPGWGKPIHTLMVENNATIFFHGHDHFYGKQDKDGIVYQEVPQPSTKNFTNISASQYGYVNGIFIPSRGYLLVTVTDTSTHVEYIRTYLPNEENATRHNGDVSHSYTIVKTGPTEVIESNTFPNDLVLNQNYPNPFNPETSIKYTIPIAGNVQLKVFDILGREITTIVDQYQQPGTYTVSFNTQKLSLTSGIYYYKISSGNYSKIMKMICLK